MSAAYIEVHSEQFVFMEATNMDPDQAAPLGAVWSGSILLRI